MLSANTAVVAAAHAFMRLGLRHKGCAVRAFAALPAECGAVFDHVKLASEGGVAIIVHVSLVPAARMPIAAFMGALDAWQAVNCRIEANADAADDDNDEEDDKDKCDDDDEEDD